jgi:hypothetical protein
MFHLWGAPYRAGGMSQACRFTGSGWLNDASMRHYGVAKRRTAIWVSFRRGRIDQRIVICGALLKRRAPAVAVFVNVADTQFLDGNNRRTWHP